MVIVLNSTSFLPTRVEGLIIRQRSYETKLGRKEMTRTSWTGVHDQNTGEIYFDNLKQYLNVKFSRNTHSPLWYYNIYLRNAILSRAE